MIADRFRERFGGSPSVIASAPGRVNLIGEHVDYNDGFVLPMAIDKRVWVAVAPNARGATHIEAGGGGARYVEAVLRLLRSPSFTIPDVDVLVAGDVPIGSGLSSSAALELATARAFAAFSGMSWDAPAMALLCQRAENEIIGVRCGIMDQLTSACGQRGCMLLVDCRSLDVTAHPVPLNLAVIVMDTGVRRSLAASEYNDRRAACERVIARIRAEEASVRSLRDVSAALLESARDLVDARDFDRASHVVAEMWRPQALVAALRDRDLTRAGALMSESHASLRDLYSVSSQQLDLICDMARQHPACVGARLTGAGFGGCAIALVDADRTDDFISVVQPQYESHSYKKSAFFVARPDDGARIES